LMIAAIVLSVTGMFAADTVAEGAGQSVREKIAKNHKILSEGKWQGYQRTKFDFNGRTAWVVEPSIVPLPGKPWTWTMQWAEAYVDHTGVPDLLGKGFHHATLEAFDLRATEEGLEQFAQFQKFLVDELGFAPKVNLVGLSWGGFFSTRYTAKYPANVAKIYLDGPLLNFDGFSGNGPWAEIPPADGNWGTDPRMPVNMAETIAKAGIPILLLYGGQDQTVNPAKNCELFATRFKEAGGKIDVIKRGLYGHHPHGVDPDKTAPITNFFLSK